MFTINGIIWTVKIVNPHHPFLEMPNGKYAIGVCDRNYKVICISNELHGKDFKETLCHEIVHAAVFSYNIQIDYNYEEYLANFISKYGHEIINFTDTTFKKINRGYF